MRLIFNLIKLIVVTLIGYFFYIEYYLLVLILILIFIVMPFVMKSKKGKKLTRQYSKKILSFKGVFISAGAFLFVIFILWYFWDYKLIIVLVLVAAFIIARIVYYFSNRMSYTSDGENRNNGHYRFAKKRTKKDFKPYSKRVK